jgi:serine/threonine protein kinase
MASLDLRRFHIQLTLKPSSPQLFIDDVSIYEMGNLYALTIHLGSDVYDIHGQLGKGKFGTTYSVSKAGSPTMYACKVIKDIKPRENLLGFFKECLINILLAEASKDEPNGPYVPRLYRIAYNPDTKQAFILSEVMRNTFDTFLKTRSKAENDKAVPDSLKQIATMLDFFGKEYRFNHRDLKGDNIMYVKTPENKYLFRLIDFGFSCIRWNNVKIAGDSYFEERARCYKTDRDLSQFIYSVIRYYDYYLSKELYKCFANIIIANVGEHKCKMNRDCPRNGLFEWGNTYNFLDRDNVHVPKGTPAGVIREMELFLKADGKKSEKADKAVKDCPPDFILNPKTRRCVKRSGAIGKKLAADEKPAEAKPNNASACPEGTIRNPKTRRCVKRDGAIGKKVLAGEIV